MFPMELVSRVAEKQAVQFQQEGDNAYPTFPGGVSMGTDRHLIEPLKLLLKSPVVTNKGVHIMVEIINTIGPMCVFKFIRATRPEQIVRSVGLAENESYV